MTTSRRVILGATARAVWTGLNQAAQDDLIPALRALVADPVPKHAISISNKFPRFRLQVGDLTIGYEVDQAQDVVVVKAILPDTGRDTDDARMLELMKRLTGA